MLAIDLSKVVAGFNDPVHDSQRIFRHSLDALSHPGTVIEVTPATAIPEQAQPSAALLLLALLDADSQLWLSPSLANSDAAHWIVFHTNCKLVEDPALADFAWSDSFEEMPLLASFNQGSDEYPELSTTCLLNVAGFANGLGDEQALTFQGPGISGTTALRLKEMTSASLAHFLSQWRMNKSQFPKGVDVFLCGSTQIAGLPRTTQLTLSDSTDCSKG